MREHPQAWKNARNSILFLEHLSFYSRKEIIRNDEIAQSIERIDKYIRLPLKKYKHNRGSPKKLGHGSIYVNQDIISRCKVRAYEASIIGMKDNSVGE